MSPFASHAAPAAVRPEAVWKTILESAAVEVFEMMAGVRPEIMPDETPDSRADHTAMVGLAGALCGMCTVRCSASTAAKIASLMVGAEAAKDPNTVGDGLGEICNMVAGNFKSKVSSLNDKCMLSVPTFIRGEDYLVQTLNPSEDFNIALSYDGAPVWIALVVHT